MSRAISHHLLEDGDVAQPVGHPARRLAFGEVAGKARVVAASPSPYPLTAQRSFLELESSFGRFGEHVHDRRIALW
jgi:hypothetical protein